MDVAVVYESHYGQTRRVAEAIAEGAGEAGADARSVPLEDATGELLEEVRLLVLGAPTHSLGMSRPWTRAKVDPARLGTHGAIADGVREWLADLVPPDRERMAAAFDTRLPSPLAGGAAHGIAKGLERHGYTVVGEAHAFVVEEAEGPLREGEEERAHAWGGELARLALGASQEPGR